MEGRKNDTPMKEGLVENKGKEKKTVHHPPPTASPTPKHGTSSTEGNEKKTDHSPSTASPAANRGPNKRLPDDVDKTTRKQWDSYTAFVKYGIHDALTSDEIYFDADVKASDD